MAFGAHRPSHRDRRLVVAGVRQRDDGPVPGRWRSVGAARALRGRTGITSAGWRVAIRLPANRSGASTWPACRVPHCCRLRWARPRTRRPGLPRTTELRMPAEATARLVDGARSRGVTVNTLMQMAWALVLSRLTDTHDVVFGVTVSGRPAELAGVETMIGLFINTVPMRVRLDPAASVGEQCRAVQRNAALLREHSYLGHAQLRALGGVGEMFDTLLVYENFPLGGLAAGGELTAAGATFRPAALQSLSHFPITIAAHMADGELVVLIEVIDGALGATPAATFGQRVLLTAERLLHDWERPLREVSVLFEDEMVPPPAAGGRVGDRHPHAIRRSRRQDTGQPRGQLGGRHTELPRTGHPRQRAGRPARGRRGAARNPGGDPAFPRAPVRRRDAGGAQSRRDVRADGAGNAPGPGGIDPAPIRRFHCGRRGVARGRRTSGHRLPPGRGAARAGRVRRLHVGHDGRTQGRHRDSRWGGCLRRRSSGQRVAAGGRPTGPAAAHRARVVVRVRRGLAAVGRAARRPRGARRGRAHPDRRRGAGRRDRRTRYRHDRHHPVDVCPTRGMRFAQHGSPGGAGAGWGSARQTGLGPHPRRMRAHGNGGLQLLRPDRNHGRGGGGRHRGA